MYQKEIIYLGLYKDGDRLGSAGFLKVEKRDKDGNLLLVVKNVPHSINGKYPVRYYNGSDWKEADDITVREGGGQWEKQEPDSLEQVRLQIILPGGYLVEGASKEAVRQTSVQKMEEKGRQPANVEPEGDSREKPATRETVASLASDPAVGEPAVSLGEGVVEGEPANRQSDRYTVAETDAEPFVPVQEQHVAAKQPAAVKAPGLLRENAVPQEPPKEIERIVVQKRGSRGSGGASGEQPKPLMADAFVIEGLKEDKWEQILDTYDNIHPYGDGRVYVKLEPKDFIILSGKYQHLVNNSFLLHGFYNYRHVILGKEGEVYYLGVPGVFYEREKMVALMFGFEAFECDSGESKAGEFGYYLRKVEL
ncbi:MAG: hypothetical protein K2H37_12630 [Lachnospiraceae bacterium]|nr:hypothetical protein [Lachnospiraceae bacterium]